MKTLVELYVNEQFDDLAAFLSFRPETVLFLTPGTVPSRSAREGIVRFVQSIDPSAKAGFIEAGNRSPDAILTRLENVFEEYPDCAVDLTGGSTTLLLAFSRFVEKKKVKAFYFDSLKNGFRSVRGMEKEIERAGLPSIDIETLFRMGGAAVTGTAHTTGPYRENAETVKALLDVYSEHIDRWNAFSEYLQFAVRSCYDARTQRFLAPSAVSNRGNLYLANRSILKKLNDCGAISDLETEGETVGFLFRNSYIKEILTTVGMCLELYIYVSALESGLFDSVAMSVVFDWDGVINGRMNDTTNELDVLMTKGISSLFVSCKAARPDTRDLYEISYLAKRFGGRNARAVLATAADLSSDSWPNYMRARDMGVTVIEKSDIRMGRERVIKLLLDPEWYPERPHK
ncbi:MAG: DUF1887 family protein [Clostridiales bacterium]|nr:DUF1887 family protein [Clostridiales bacterium]